MSTVRSLSEELADALPNNHKFTLNHISTAPTRCDPLYSPPPNGKIERTYCESQFLNVSVRTDSQEDIFIMAIECLVYTTRRLTTIFVSKADSTGYLSLLNLPKGNFESPLRIIASVFIQWLVRERMRPGVKCVVDLFARASDQYLYPGSVENTKKHVSDDRQLVKWWCRILHTLLSSYAPKPPAQQLFSSPARPDKAEISEKAKTTAQAYLLVPGAEAITSFLPDSVRYDSKLRSRWTHGHPLREIAMQPNLPPRCLLPHFPDDPKGRFVNELDAELPDASVTVNSGNSQGGGKSAASMLEKVAPREVEGGAKSPRKKGTGMWRSVRSLEQFWEMMAYRSECSSGRLVGFLWVVIDSPAPEISLMDSFESQTSQLSQMSTDSTKTSPKKRTKPATLSRTLSGPITSRLPRIKSSQPSFNDLPEKSPYYTWPTSSRGTLIIDKRQYDKANEILLRLDFANERIGVRSTKSWIEEVAVLGGAKRDWGVQIVGRKEAAKIAVTAAPISPNSINQPNVLSIKRKSNDATTRSNGASIFDKKVRLDPPVSEATSVNVLGAGMIRKKPKKIQPTLITQ